MTAEELAPLIIAAIRQQGGDAYIGDVDDCNDVCIDGYINLLDLADTILEGMSTCRSTSP